MEPKSKGNTVPGGRIWEIVYLRFETSYLNLIALPFGVSTITFRYPVSGSHAGMWSGPRVSTVRGLWGRLVLRALALSFD